jgi:hypothetical protein
MATPGESPKHESVIAPKIAENNGSLCEMSMDSYYIDPVKERKMMRKFDVGQALGSSFKAGLFPVQLFPG